LYIFKNNRSKIASEPDAFTLHKHIIVKDLAIFNEVCMDFYFKNSEEIIFVKFDQIFTINFETEEVLTVLKFSEPLLIQPQFFEFNEDMSIAIIASDSECLLVNLTTRK
jgi:hypothetical protein